MNSDQGHWELVSPLPDCPVGTKARACIMGIFSFPTGGDRNFSFDVDEMKRNPAIFRWVPEPEKGRRTCIRCGAVRTEAWQYKVNHFLCPDCVIVVPKPERVEWPEPDEVDNGRLEWSLAEGYVEIRCKTFEGTIPVMKMCRAVLKALREGKDIASVSHSGGHMEILIRPDGSTK